MKKPPKNVQPPPDGKSLVPGRKALSELLHQRPKSVRRVFRLNTMQPNPAMKTLLSELEQAEIPVVEANREELAALAPDVHHQGILTEVSPRTPVSLNEIIQRSVGRNNLLLVLDEIQDPQNLGALLRVADACGVDGVVVPERRAVHLTPAVRKVSAGAAEFVPLAVVPNLAQALRTLKEKGFWILGTALGGESRSLYDTDPGSPLAVVIGSEADGLRELTRSLCDFLVEIPMHGAVQSLNASHAAAVILAEIQRRRHAGNTAK